MTTNDLSDLVDGLKKNYKPVIPLSDWLAGGPKDGGYMMISEGGLLINFDTADELAEHVKSTEGASE